MALAHIQEREREMDVEKVSVAGSAEIDTRKVPETTSAEMTSEVSPAKTDIEKVGEAALAKVANVVASAETDIEKVGEAASAKIVSVVASAEKGVEMVGDAAAKMVNVVVSAEKGIGKVGDAAAKVVSVVASAKNDIGKVSEAAAKMVGAVALTSAEMILEKVGEAGPAEIDIEKVRVAASAHYKELPEDQKQAAERFFEAMDTDKSGNISIDEFVTFLSLFGFQGDNHEWLFAKLDKDDNGTLDFHELVTFFYILSRDEYKHLVDCKPSADVPRRKLRFGLRRRGANNQKWNRSEVAQLYKKLQGTYKLGKWVNENSCCIL
ncbi:hypothetical protein BT93_L5898 [Corymbia citriodora subsp. variegata]|uniref:EF-hand domain-containing protein n=1 Tax=Corymbia citriodora subsp. variegata TaxID=360336 RepID=A0A8T0CQY5_CORYI|nr:hypothetical protein BT93_L5898 [Corymbia citriodora subsp. variegata]